MGKEAERTACVLDTGIVMYMGDISEDNRSISDFVPISGRCIKNIIGRFDTWRFAFSDHFIRGIAFRGLVDFFSGGISFSMVLTNGKYL